MIPYSEALTAIAAVSAALWTGGLVVLQLARDGSKDENARLNNIRGGLAMAAFGAIAPLFGLFISGDTLRITAFAFALLYTLKTLGAVPQIVADIKKGWLWNAPLFLLLPKLAMIVVAIWPYNRVIAWSSVMLAFLGYYVLFDEILRPTAKG